LLAITRHGIVVTAFLFIESLIYCVLVILRRIGALPPEVTHIIELILIWAAVINITIFCVQAVAVVGLIAGDEISNLYRQIREAKRP